AFRATLAEDPEAIANAIGGPNGLAARLETVVGSLVGENGAITRRRDGLTSQVAGVSEQREDLDRRLESVRERFLRQFIALDTLIAQLQSTSSFISQQLSATQS
ncbi:MAG: flagellar hook protein FliD, partial [Gammaproteobacteria bacterium HGW-Gammaproteobacteria-7]